MRLIEERSNALMEEFDQISKEYDHKYERLVYLRDTGQKGEEYKQLHYECKKILEARNLISEQLLGLLEKRIKHLKNKDEQDKQKITKRIGELNKEITELDEIRTRMDKRIIECGKMLTSCKRLERKIKTK